MIGYPTVPGRGKMPEMAGYIAEAFRRSGWIDVDVEVVPYDTGSPDGTAIDSTAALTVRWRASGTQKQRSFVVMGHMDVVGASPRI